MKRREKSALVAIAQVSRIENCKMPVPMNADTDANANANANANACPQDAMRNRFLFLECIPPSMLNFPIL